MPWVDVQAMSVSVGTASVLHVRLRMDQSEIDTSVREFLEYEEGRDRPLRHLADYILLLAGQGRLEAASDTSHGGAKKSRR